MAWILDLDGVVWLGEVPIPGSAEAIGRLRTAGQRVCFVTNNSSQVVGEQEAKLAEMGIPAEGEVLTSAMAAALLLEPGETALVCGGPGVSEALERRGVHTVREGAADAVVVGFHLDFDYGRLKAAHAAVRDGARLIGTNDDTTYPTPEGVIPGGGAILAAVAAASGVAPVVAGKPYPPMAALVRELAGDGPHVVVGDRPSTDGLFAVTLGATFGLVLSGVTTGTDLPVTPEPAWVSDDLATLVAARLPTA
ncbi:MAG TPA: HAD-IIA family hydrolase [Acidimicrobiales bacterium]|nr:HAD-IIA family hydrolase [Acidimicrobiales bacterium]